MLNVNVPKKEGDVQINRRIGGVTFDFKTTSATLRFTHIEMVFLRGK